MACARALLDAPHTKAGGQHPASPWWGCWQQLRAQNRPHPEPRRSLAVSSVSSSQGRGTQGSLSQPAGGCPAPRGHGEGRWEAAVVCTAIQRRWHASARLGSLFPLFFHPFLTAPPHPRLGHAPPLRPLSPSVQQAQSAVWGGRGCGLPTFPIPLFPRFAFGFSGMGSGPRRGGRGRELSRK